MFIALLFISELLKFAHAYTEIHVYPSIIVLILFFCLLSIDDIIIRMRRNMLGKGRDLNTEFYIFRPGSKACAAVLTSMSMPPLCVCLNMGRNKYHIRS